MFFQKLQFDEDFDQLRMFTPYFRNLKNPVVSFFFLA